MKNLCCKIDENLGTVETLPDAKEGETFRRCQLCGCRHFTLMLDPTRIGLQLDKFKEMPSIAQLAKESLRNKEINAP